MNIILASGSPRRAELLKKIGLDFSVKPANADESYEEGMPAEQVVYELSARKAEAAFDEALPVDDTLIIAADTVVELDGMILGKPKDEADAVSMLSSLSGKAHRVHTGVTLYSYTDRKINVDTFVVTTTVHFANMSAEDIKKYVATGEPMDKAGAYGIQGRGELFISSVEGSYSNVVGLPMQRLYSALKELGVI